jgi:2-dehydro-3-deoxyphosphooctonate aldolase (KDO 8-P synthase)
MEKEPRIRTVSIGSLEIGPESPLVIFCGPCVIEGEEFTLRAAEFLKNLFGDLGIGLVFKASYDKANRSSIQGFRGVGMDEGLRILEKVKNEFDLPVVSDVHTVEEVRAAQEIIDVLQVPAFLSRQTDLILAAAKSGRVVEVKKGQFLAPWDMEQVVHKVTSEGNHNLLLVDRGTSFGYNNLVSDMRGIPIMQKLGYPVGFDATHSVQLPGGNGTSSGGQREFVPPLAKAALAAGANFLFMEAHPNPEEAKSDKAAQIPFSALASLLNSLKRLYDHLREEVALSV